MDDTDPRLYGASIADEYDDLYEDVLDTEGAVALLTDLAAARPVLELGVGTGRIALPLRANGVPVHGVEVSDDMVSQLRTKPGGADLPVTMGDFRTVDVGQRFAVVALPFNTIFALPNQDDQVQVFENVARHLEPGGLFVLEAWIPDLSRFHRHQGVWPRQVGSGAASLELATHDPVAQVIRTTQVRFRNGEVRVHPANHRYAWPSELDVMGRLAGLRLRERWADWRRTPFGPDSTGHVSVYVRPA